MLVSLVLFETEFLNIVSISFTSLILNELIMVALEITTWYARVSFHPSHVSLTAPAHQAHVHGHLGGGHALLLCD